MTRFALLVSVSGLIGSAAHAQPAPCIPYFRSAEALALEANAVRFCDDEGPKKQQCFSTDLATGKTTTAKRPTPTPNAVKGTTLAIKGKTAKACSATGSCKTFKPKTRIAEGLGMRGVARDNLVVLINMDQIETFDLRKGTPIATFSAGKGDCTSVTILAGDVLLVQNAPCGDDDGETPGTNWFATPAGKRLAAVGGDRPIDVAPPELIDTRVAFVSKQGDEVIVQDGKTGKVSKRFPLGKPQKESYPQLLADDKRIVVVFGGRRGGDVAVIDLATDKVTAFAATRCP